MAERTPKYKDAAQVAALAAADKAMDTANINAASAMVYAEAAKAFAMVAQSFGER